MHKVERPKPRKDEARHDEVAAYTVDEVRHILACLDKEPLKWQALVRLLIDTGIRRGECCGLQWKDINFQDNTIAICGNLCYTPKKGVYLDTPKNGRSRTIDVDPDIIALLRSLRSQQAAQAISSRTVSLSSQLTSSVVPSTDRVSSCSDGLAESGSAASGAGSPGSD